MKKEINKVKWEPIEYALTVTDEGVLHYDSSTFKIYTLSDGKKVFAAEDVQEYISKLLTTQTPQAER